MLTDHLLIARSRQVLGLTLLRVASYGCAQLAHARCIVNLTAGSSTSLGPRSVGFVVGSGTGSICKSPRYLAMDILHYRFPERSRLVVRISPRPGTIRHDAGMKVWSFRVIKAGQILHQSTLCNFSRTLTAPQYGFHCPRIFTVEHSRIPQK